jgi:hypothetical protein
MKEPIRNNLYHTLLDQLWEDLSDQVINQLRDHLADLICEIDSVSLRYYPGLDHLDERTTF